MSQDAPPSEGPGEAILERLSDGVVALDSDLQITYSNGAAASLLTADRETLLGTPVLDALDDQVASVVRPPLERALESGTEQSCEWYGPSQDSWLVRFYPDDDGVTVVVSETTDHRRHEETLGRLHEATRQMLLADSPEQVADFVSHAAVEVLGLPINAVHYYDDEAGTLVPVAQSPACYDVLGDPPELDSGLAWTAYQTGNVGVYPDLRAEAEAFDAETPFRSELVVPLADYGVFIVAAETADAFTEADVTLAKLLGANATVALEQVTSENRLARQRDNLELLTRMMSHDIRNDLQVVGAVAEMLGEHVEGTQREYVEKIRRSTAAAVELTTSAQELVEAMLRTDTEPVPVALRTILSAQIDRVAETHTAATITVDGEIPDVGVLADEMLGSVFRNVLKNAVQHNRGDDPTVVVNVDTDAETVRVRVADDGPGVPDERKESIFGRGERGMSSEGTGIGLYLVQTLVEQYGGRVWVTDNDPTGAVLVVELRRQ
ncbi:sensor histidine kinase [Haloarcula onubensis]|uniref:histidine kinase n=1 Tax=Haloarcula onubensis TaxID=2950539 RepID=A0ABU2FTL1_9EURY|nr:ATP-binding protein [Halomicroarcula sp. S3CR25-11]MDS0284103.1 ATP-binding protein [Halomicroarcula sp. S3CR25-11]